MGIDFDIVSNSQAIVDDSEQQEIRASTLETFFRVINDPKYANLTPSVQKRLLQLAGTSPDWGESMTPVINQMFGSEEYKAAKEKEAVKAAEVEKLQNDLAKSNIELSQSTSKYYEGQAEYSKLKLELEAVKAQLEQAEKIPQNLEATEKQSKIDKLDAETAKIIAETNTIVGVKPSNK